MICDNEMCFDLTEKHPEEKKKTLSLGARIKRHQRFSLFVCFLLFVNFVCV